MFLIDFKHHFTLRPGNFIGRFRPKVLAEDHPQISLHDMIPALTSCDCGLVFCGVPSCVLLTWVFWLEACEQENCIREHTNTPSLVYN